MKFNFFETLYTEIIRSKKNFKRKELKLACNVELGDIFCCIHVKSAKWKRGQKAIFSYLQSHLETQKSSQRWRWLTNIHILSKSSLLINAFRKTKKCGADRGKEINHCFSEIEMKHEPDRFVSS